MTGYVYAMLSCDRVKIGYTERPKQRLSEANTMSPFPVDLLRCDEGSINDERRLHKKFADLRLHGEWFAFCGPVKMWAQGMENQINQANESNENVKMIIDRFGGLSAMAKALEHKHPTTVQGWKKSGKIPSWRIHEVMKAAEANNIKLPPLKEPAE